MEDFEYQHHGQRHSSGGTCAAHFAKSILAKMLAIKMKPELYDVILAPQTSGKTTVAILVLLTQNNRRHNSLQPVNALSVQTRFTSSNSVAKKRFKDE